MASTVPLCESLGLDIPADYDEQSETYVKDYPFPCHYDAAEKRWFFEDGELIWDAVFERWKARVPMNEIYVESFRRSRSQVGTWLDAA